MAIFEPAFQFVMKHEDSTLSGKVTWDQGGLLTKWGISQRYHPHVDVEHLTLKGAKEIYFTEYWLPFHLDYLDNQEVASKIFDTLVNPGSAFVRTIQHLVSAAPDGIMGLHTISLLNQCNPDILIEALCNAQESHYREFDSHSDLLDGLVNRAKDKPTKEI